MKRPSNAPDRYVLSLVLLKQSTELFDCLMRWSLDFNVHGHFWKLSENIFEEWNTQSLGLLHVHSISEVQCDSRKEFRQLFELKLFNVGFNPACSDEIAVMVHYQLTVLGEANIHLEHVSMAALHTLPKTLKSVFHMHSGTPSMSYSKQLSSLKCLIEELVLVCSFTVQQRWEQK